MITKSGVERALVACGAADGSIILATDGEWLASDVENIGDNPDEIGLGLPPATGLWLWTGTGRLCAESVSGEPPYPEYDGVWRTVTVSELTALLAMKPLEKEQR